MTSKLLIFPLLIYIVRWRHETGKKFKVLAKINKIFYSCVNCYFVLSQFKLHFKKHHWQSRTHLKKHVFLKFQLEIINISKHFQIKQIRSYHMSITEKHFHLQDLLLQEKEIPTGSTGSWEVAGSGAQNIPIFVKVIIGEQSFHSVQGFSCYAANNIMMW